MREAAKQNRQQRKAPRRDLDAYYTPPELARFLVGLLGDVTGASVLEPSVGGGAFARALVASGAIVHAIDLNGDAEGLADANGETSTRDFLAPLPDDFPSSFDLVVGNPPYNAAEAHVRRGLEVAGSVAMLLRLAFLESAERVCFWREHPVAEVFVLAERPSFTGGGTDNSAYAWFVWRRGHSGPAALSVVSWKGGT
jgi:tRNA G10  N-methylase Trm11